MWNPCVRVTHLMLTPKVWPSHAWLHMCEAHRLRCDTHTLSHTQHSPVICLPHPTYSRSTSSNYCVFVRKSRTRQAKSASGAIKHKSGASGPSPWHLTKALTSLPFLACTHWYESVVCWGYSAKPKVPRYSWKGGFITFHCFNFDGLHLRTRFKRRDMINPIKLFTQLKYYFHHY